MVTDSHIYIISWAGQHENAIVIANQILQITDAVFVVYSDPDPELNIDFPCKSIRRPNELFWADKFQACLNTCEDNPMIVIHADCTYSNWADLIQSCYNSIKLSPIIGVWSPKIDYVPWTMKMVEIAKVNGTSLSVVARTDGIVFYLSPKIIKRMRKANYKHNIYGRGIELMFVTSCYAKGMIAVIDQAIKVNHPKSTGYSEKEAHTQFLEFIKQLNTLEEVQRILLKTYMIKNGGRPLIPN